MNASRMVLRMVERDKDGKVYAILEQDIPATDHAVELYLRRAPFKETVAHAMLSGGTVSIERKLS